MHDDLTPPAGPSIAVLPFADATPGRVDDHFSEGFAEEIISALARVRGLKVIARASAFEFRNRCSDRRRASDMLGVRHLLEGRVRRDGARVAVSATLIDTAEACHPLWSLNFERDVDGMLGVLYEIAVRVCQSLGLPDPQPASHRPVFAAYQLVLKGRHFEWRITPDTAALSRSYFEDAVEADPAYATAQTELGVHYLNQAMFSLMSAQDAMPRVRQQAERALALQPGMPEALVLLGAAAGLYDHDWRGAGRFFGDAVAVDPVSPWVRAMYGMCFLLHVGRVDDALAQLRAAVELDPLSSPVRYSLGGCLLAAGHDGEGRQELETLLGDDPDFLLAHGALVTHDLGRGAVEAAHPRIERLFAAAGWDPYIVGLTAGARARLGDEAGAAAALALLADGQAYGAPMGFIMDALVRGDAGTAADWFPRAVAQRYPALLFPMRQPIGRVLRESAHWPGLAQSIGLTA